MHMQRAPQATDPNRQLTGGAMVHNSSQCPALIMEKVRRSSPLCLFYSAIVLDTYIPEYVLRVFTWLSKNELDHDDDNGLSDYQLSIVVLLWRIGFV